MDVVLVVIGMLEKKLNKMIVVMETLETLVVTVVVVIRRLVTA